MTRLIMVSLTVLGLFFSSGCLYSSPSFVVRNDLTKRDLTPKVTADGKYNIYLITMDQISEYWQNIDAGCKAAVDNIGDVNYYWIAPSKNDVTKQRQSIEQAMNAGADAILLSASSATGLDGILTNVTDAGIKLIYVDSDATHEATATILTDNELAGKIAAETMKQALSKAGITHGRIGIGVSSSKVKNAILRDRGFREAFSGTRFEVVPTVDYDSDRKNIEKYVSAHRDCVAFFGGNEQVTQILGEQVQAEGISPIIVGFDASDYTLSMVQQGVIYATLQQKPEDMGYEGLTIAVSALKGEYRNIGAEIYTKVNVITKDKT